MRDTIDMAREAGYQHPDAIGTCEDFAYFDIERFAELVRADERGVEREACANLVFHSPPSDEYESPLNAVYEAIRARGETK